MKARILFIVITFILVALSVSATDPIIADSTATITFDTVNSKPIIKITIINVPKDSIAWAE